MTTTDTSINFPAVFIANGVGIFLVLAILHSRRKPRVSSLLDSRLFYAMCQLCMILCLLETAGFLLDGLNFWGVACLLRVSNALLFTLGAVLSIFWISYIDYKLFESKERLCRRIPFLSIPAAIVIVLSLANIFINVFFGIDQNNRYFRKALSLLPYIVTCGYLTFGALMIYWYRHKTNKYIYFPTVVFLVPVYLGCILQYLFYGLAVIWMSVAIGLTFLHMNLQNEKTFLDPLTNLYNRNYLTHYIHEVSKKKKLTGILMDINNFKGINDTYGHLEGDRVLQTVGRILLQAASKGVVVRYGGDEFVVLFEDGKKENVEKFFEELEVRLKVTNANSNGVTSISLSAGVAELNESDVSAFFRKMDQNMYREKKAFYQQQRTFTSSDAEGVESVTQETNTDDCTQIS